MIICWRITARTFIFMNNLVVYLSETKGLNKAGLKAAIKSVSYNSGAASLLSSDSILHSCVNILGLL